MGIENVKETEGLEKEDKKVIVEIGCGEAPFPLSGKRKLKENETYIGIEPDLRNVKNTRMVLKDLKKFGQVNEFKIYKRIGEKTELPENYADEIVLMNVAGFRNLVLKFDAFAKEAARILKKQGKTYIVETNTPYENPNEIIKFFENGGFKLIEYIKLEDGEEAKNELVKYMFETMLSPDSYMLVFVKTS